MVKNKIVLCVIDDSDDDAALLEHEIKKCDPTSFEFRRMESVSHLAVWYSSGGDHPDCIVLDLMLGQTSGLESLEKLLFVTDMIEPTVVLTSQREEEVGLQAVVTGAQDCIEKGKLKGKALIRVILYAMARNVHRLKLRNQVAALKRHQEIQSKIMEISKRLNLLAGESVETKLTKEQMESIGVK